MPTKKKPFTKKKPTPRAVNRWSQSVHVSAFLTLKDDQYIPMDEVGEDYSYTADKLYLTSKGALVGTAGCGDTALLAKNKDEMMVIGQFIAECCGHTLTPKTA